MGNAKLNPIPENRNLFNAESMSCDNEMFKMMDDGDIFEGFTLSGSYMYCCSDGYEDCFFFDNNPTYVRVQNPDFEPMLAILPSTLSGEKAEKFIVSRHKIDKDWVKSVSKEEALEEFGKLETPDAYFPIKIESPCYTYLMDAINKRRAEGSVPVNVEYELTHTHQDRYFLKSVTAYTQEELDNPELKEAIKSKATVRLKLSDHYMESSLDEDEPQL